MQPLPEPDLRPEPLGASRGRRRVVVLLVVALLVIAGVAAGLGWWLRAPPPAAPAPVAALPPPAPAPAPPAPAEPEVRHPIEDAPVAAEAEAAAAPEAADPLAALLEAVTGLVGRDATLTRLQTDQFVRRIVATVDNLDRAHAAPALWPVVPTAGRFVTAPVPGGGAVVAPANAARYAAFVAFVGAVDMRRAAALYVRHYPLFQQAYRDLGYPRGQFNDRLVAVIDTLLATPEAPSPLAVQLTEVKGPVAPARPWVRYEFADPALERLASGQKMLLRVGPDQARVLKGKLRELRAAVTKAP